jgi:hypothetical protein
LVSGSRACSTPSAELSSQLHGAKLASMLWQQIFQV